MADPAGDAAEAETAIAASARLETGTGRKTEDATGAVTKIKRSPKPKKNKGERILLVFSPFFYIYFFYVRTCKHYAAFCSRSFPDSPA